MISLAVIGLVSTMLAPEMGIVQFGTLLTGPSKQKLAPEVQARMQKEHVERFEAMWNKGLILAVGPLEKAGDRRGIVVFNVKTTQEAMDLMADDPFVKSGHMVFETKPWYCEKTAIHKAPKFMDMEAVWLGYLVRPENAPSVSKEEGAKIQEGHMANINKMAASGDLAIAGPMGSDGALRGLFVFINKDEAKVKELVAQDPAIKAGRLKLELVKWYLAKGTFVPFKTEKL